MRPRPARGPCPAARVAAQLAAAAWISALLAAALLAAAVLVAPTPAAAQTPAVPPAASPPGDPPPDQGEDPAGLAERLVQRAWEQLQGQSVVLGLGYAQGTAKFAEFGGDRGVQPQLTDNGRFDLLLQYETTERYFAEYPLVTGRAAFGFNFVGSVSGLVVDRQLHGNAFQGEDLGSAVKGSYVAGAPMVFLRLGPLYPNRSVFWKAGAGLGLGLIEFEGRVLLNVGEADQAFAPVDSGGPVPALLMTYLWELEMDDWLIVFKSILLNGRAGDQLFSYELYSLGVGYKLRF